MKRQLLDDNILMVPTTTTTDQQQRDETSRQSKRCRSALTHSLPEPKEEEEEEEEEDEESSESWAPEEAVGKCGCCMSYVGAVGQPMRKPDYVTGSPAVIHNLGNCYLCHAKTCKSCANAVLKPDAGSILVPKLTLANFKVRQPQYDVGKYDRHFRALLNNCISLFGPQGDKKEASDEEFQAAIRVICVNYYEDEDVKVDRKTGVIDNNATYAARKFICRGCVNRLCDSK